MAFTRSIKEFKNDEEWFKFLGELERRFHQRGNNTEFYSVETSKGNFSSYSSNDLLRFETPAFPFKASIIEHEVYAYNPNGADNLEYMYILFHEDIEKEGE